MTDTTPVPDDLLARIAAASDAGKVEELRSLATEMPVPTPPPSTLRIIDIAMCERTIDRDRFRTTRTAEFDPEYIDHIAEQPDPMTVIERAVSDWWGLSRRRNPQSLTDAIRAALGGATQ